nr:MAG TPA_asm: hypothetical protein [Caudoviricetes sp.]
MGLLLWPVNRCASGFAAMTSFFVHVAMSYWTL